MTSPSPQVLPENAETLVVRVEDRSLYWRRRALETLLSADRAGPGELRSVHLTALIHHRRMAALS